MITPSTIQVGLAAANGIFAVVKRTLAVVTGAVGNVLSGAMKEEDFNAAMVELQGSAAELDAVLDALDTHVTSKEQNIQARFDRILGRTRTE